MLMKTVLGAIGVLTLTVGASACSAADDSPASDESNLNEKAIVCSHVASYPNKPLAAIMRANKEKVAANDTPVIANYTSWPTYEGEWDGKYDANIVTAKASADDARKNIASRFGDCEGKVSEHIETKKPNVYIYFSGYGGPTQNNAVVDEAGILRWVNQRDPKALIFSINWSCENSHDGFCKANAAKLTVAEGSPEMKSMKGTVNAIAPQTMAALNQILAATAANQDGYNTALSHSMQLSALLVDQLLMADDGGGNKSLLGDIHFIGYSMGAHAASQVLIQDFTGKGNGFAWTRKGQCDDGKDTCTIAHLKKVKWSLSMGLSGWSEGLQAYNKFSASGVSGRDAADTEEYRNGGMLRIADPRFNGKSKVFNRRMDPTGNSDDTFERGFGDIFFSDYNHYSHDYSLPLFVNDGFVRALDAFLESDSAKGSKEVGILADNAGLLDFDDCTGADCDASTGYLAHAQNRSHDRVTLVSAKVKTTDGVAHPDKKESRAVTFASAGAQPIALNTFEQEDLRGGVELYFRPKFAPSAAGTHGLFSYGSCKGSAEDLMPQAYLEDGKVVFTMSYLGQPYSVAVPVNKASLTENAWTHLAFTWELPVVSMASTSNPTLAQDAQKYGAGLVLASGLRKALPTTYKRQQGAGEIRIFANGTLVGKAALGSADSKRDCLASKDVLVPHEYSVGSEKYPSYTPYAGYEEGDEISMGGGSLGQKCKAYRVRNTQAFFGCAKSAAVNAAGDMDDIALVWGPGRTEYENVDHATGAAKNWDVGARYDATAFKVK